MNTANVTNTPLHVAAQRIWFALSQPALEMGITRAYFPENYALSSAICMKPPSTFLCRKVDGRQTPAATTQVTASDA